MTELLITSKVPGKLIYWRAPHMIHTGQNPNTDTYVSHDDYRGQGFWAPVSYEIWKVEINMLRDGSPGDITLELWECSGDGNDDNPSTKIADLATKEASDVPTSFDWVTFECENSPILEKGKKYAVIVHADQPDSNNKYKFKLLHDDSRTDGQHFFSEDGSSWGRSQCEDLEMRIYFGKEFRVEDKGFSEAYLLRIEYLEDGTEITVDDEITFRGDAGEMDVLPTAILIPFKKITYESGQVKVFGVGIP